MNKYIVGLALMLFISACSSNQDQLSLLSKTPMYKRAYKDGCSTAKGNYRKNHYAFNNKQAYYNGWFAGRHDCQQR